MIQPTTRCVLQTTCEHSPRRICRCLARGCQTIPAHSRRRKIHRPVFASQTSSKSSTQSVFRGSCSRCHSFLGFLRWRCFPFSCLYLSWSACRSLSHLGCYWRFVSLKFLKNKYFIHFSLKIVRDLRNVNERNAMRFWKLVRP